jgi:hypothetical protein
MLSFDVRWKREDVKAYRDRDWEAFERAPVEQDSTANMALAASLYEQLRRTVSGWPSDADRAEDLAQHVRMSELFARIHRAQRSRGDNR